MPRGGHARAAVANVDATTKEGLALKRAAHIAILILLKEARILLAREVCLGELGDLQWDDGDARQDRAGDREAALRSKRDDTIVAIGEGLHPVVEGCEVVRDLRFSLIDAAARDDEQCEDARASPRQLELPWPDVSRLNAELKLHAGEALVVL